MYYLKKINSESERKLERLNAILHSRNNKLRKTNNELDSFVYKASHDMRAPLTSLLGLIEICKKETDLKILGSFLELQEKSIQKLDSYIADILNISRNARVEIEIKQIDFNTMFEQLFEQLSFMDKASLVNKSIKIYHTVPFYSDPIRLNIVLNNLISNSIRYADFSKANPEINVLVKINTEQAEITITDNGIGIDNEHLTKVFNMFYRATESNSGSGLGLYIVKETIEKLNGKINMTSNLGLGTEIKIVLPNIQK
jgi:signal transduction histidine kinase